jgi:hypothetical protein
VQCHYFQLDLKTDVTYQLPLRTPLDAIKSLALGAKATGMSRPFLNQVENNGINISGLNTICFCVKSSIFLASNIVIIDFMCSINDYSMQLKV